MIPIPQTLSARFVPREAERLSAVSSILPVEGAQSEAPLWNRLRPGAQFTGVIVGKEKSASESATLATFKVQLQVPNQAPVVVLMQLPAQLTPQQTLQIQYLGQPNTAKAEAQKAETKVLWGLSANARGDASSGTVNHALHYDILQSSNEEASLLPATHSANGMATQVALSPPAQHLQRWINSPLFLEQSATLRTQGVLTHSPEKSQVLAQDLKHALDNSGLFYESHLKEATLGTRPWQQLLQEPQNKAQFSAPEMVSQQLQVLEQQRVVWQGEVWPGQPIQWQVTEREAQAQSPDAPSAYFSNMKLSLPALGEVSVRITLANGRFSIRVQAEDLATLRKMQHARQQLATNLNQAGLPLDGLQISERVAHVAG